MTAGTTRPHEAIGIDRVSEAAGPPPIDARGAPAAAGLFVYGFAASDVTA